LQLALCDLKGEKAFDFINEKMEKGQHKLKFNIPNNISKGLYYLKMEVNGLVKIKKLLVN
jgi:hypothetical protein